MMNFFKLPLPPTSKESGKNLISAKMNIFTTKLENSEFNLIFFLESMLDIYGDYYTITFRYNYENRLPGL